MSKEITDQELLDRMTLQQWTVQLTAMPGGLVYGMGFWKGNVYTAEDQPSIRHTLEHLFADAWEEQELIGRLQKYKAPQEPQE